jgi:DNA (cytosine-5)-methyltransferase 1
MKVLSLFSGIGGFDLGFERAGMEVVGMCEIDRHAQAVLQRHFPNATLHTDVRSIQYGRGAVDVICGGFPCQDLSVAGKRRGLDGERSGLWFEFARIIDEVEPKWVVIENVPGLFSSAGGRDFAVIIQWLAQRGYGVGWRVLDSQGFGLAQRRKRVFIVGSFATPHGCTLLLEPESVRWNPTPSRRSGQGDTGAVAKRLTADGQRYDYETETMIPILWESTHGDDPARLCSNQSVSPTLPARMGTGGNNVPLIGVRRLTPTECERLQGFPDGWTAGQADSHRYKQLGNAVSVPVAQWIGQRIMEVTP